MALVVEDGTGLDTAESYVSVSDCDAYHTKMGHDAWTGSTAVKEAALRKATQYIDARYAFLGTVVDEDQALQWPREDIDWPTKAITDATCELALRALSGALYSDVEPGQVQSETVGPISVTYARVNNGGQKRYALIDDLLAPYLSTGRSQTRLIRA